MGSLPDTAAWAVPAFAGVEAAVQHQPSFCTWIRFGLRNELAGYRRSDHTQHADTYDHQTGRDDAAFRSHRMYIAIADRRHSRDRPPHGIAERVNHRSWSVPLAQRSELRQQHRNHIERMLSRLQPALPSSSWFWTHAAAAGQHLTPPASSSPRPRGHPGTPPAAGTTYCRAGRLVARWGGPNSRLVRLLRR